MNWTGEKRIRSGVKGFTLTEIMVSLSIFSLVIASAAPVYIMCNRNWHRTTLNAQAATETSMALEMMVYGMGLQYGLRSAVASTVVVSATGQDWVVSYVNSEGGTNRFSYDSSETVLRHLGAGETTWTLVGSNITACAVSNNNGGMSISVTTGLVEGRYSVTNSMSTYVSYRN